MRRGEGARARRRRGREDAGPGPRLVRRLPRQRGQRLPPLAAGLVGRARRRSRTPIELSGGAHGSLSPWGRTLGVRPFRARHTKRKESTDGHEAQDVPRSLSRPSSSASPSGATASRARHPARARPRAPRRRPPPRRPRRRRRRQRPRGEHPPEPVGCSAERRDAAHGRHGVQVQALAVAKVGSGHGRPCRDGRRRPCGLEVHMSRGRDTRAVYVDKSFNVVSVQP